MGQAIAIQHVLPNTKFVESESDGSLLASALENETKYICIKQSDLGTDFDDNTGGLNFSIDYTDGSGNTTTGKLGNMDLFVRKIVGLWADKYDTYKTAYDTDQAKASADQKNTDAPPDACTTNGFTSYTTSGSTGNKLKNAITLNFLYDEPTVTLVDEDDS